MGTAQVNTYGWGIPTIFLRIFTKVVQKHIDCPLSQMDLTIQCHRGYSGNPPTQPSLGLWVLASSILVTACLSHTYAAPFLTYEPEMIQPCHLNHSHFKGLDPLEVTLYHTFDPQAKQPCPDEDHHDHYHDEEEPFCCMMSLKMVFMAGYAVGQMVMALISDRVVSQWTCLRCLIKGLILSGMLCSVTTNLHCFAICWFVLAVTASSTFLIVATHLLQRLENQEVEWKGRFLAGLLFQLNWTSSRFLANVIVYFSSHWITVISIITILVSVAYFGLEGLIWLAENEEDSKTAGCGDGWLVASQSLIHTGLALTFTWLVISFNFYGLLHSWCKISTFQRKFENEILSAVLGLIAEILACILCLVVKRKGLPLAVLQLFSAIGYFYMSCLDPEPTGDNTIGKTHWYEVLQGANGLIYVAHINSFLETAAFALLWLLTLEAFPRNIRYPSRQVKL